MTHDGMYSYTYDAEGNVIAASSGASYVYDALNRRVSATISGATNEFIYDYAGRRISTWNASTDVGNEGRIYWGSRMIAFRAVNGQTYFNQADLLGTSRLRMNSAGGAVNNYQSLAFGDGYVAQYPGAYSDQDNNHFAQLDRDADTSTEHAQFRQ